MALTGQALLAGTTTGTGLLINPGTGDATKNRAKGNGFRFTLFTAGSTYCPVMGQDNAD